MTDPTCPNLDNLDTWLVDLAGNIAATDADLRLMHRIACLHVPLFGSTEEAMEWGARLNAQQHATLVDVQRTYSNAARENGDLQQMVYLATRSQLIREAAEAFRPALLERAAKQTCTA
jgi:hypothetical protein